MLYVQPQKLDDNPNMSQLANISFDGGGETTMAQPDCDCYLYVCNNNWLLPLCSVRC